jgi:hypothetical protein
MRLYDEFVDFLVESLNPEALARFAPSAAAKSRAAQLADREQSAVLSEEDRRELEQFRTVETIVNLAKSRMRQRLISE